MHTRGFELILLSMQSLFSDENCFQLIVAPMTIQTLFFFQATRDTGYAGPSSALYHPLCCSPHLLLPPPSSPPSRYR